MMIIELEVYDVEVDEIKRSYGSVQLFSLIPLNILIWFYINVFNDKKMIFSWSPDSFG